MLEESISDEEEVLILTGESALVNHKVALLMARFVEVLLGIDFKYIVTHLETHGLQFRSDVFTAVLNMAECFIRCTIKVG